MSSDARSFVCMCHISDALNLIISVLPIHIAIFEQYDRYSMHLSRFIALIIFLSLKSRGIIFKRASLIENVKKYKATYPSHSVCNMSSSTNFDFNNKQPTR